MLVLLHMPHVHTIWLLCQQLPVPGRQHEALREKGGEDMQAAVSYRRNLQFMLEKNRLPH